MLSGWELGATEGCRGLLQVGHHFTSVLAPSHLSIVLVHRPWALHQHPSRKCRTPPNSMMCSERSSGRAAYSSEGIPLSRSPYTTLHVMAGVVGPCHTREAHRRLHCGSGRQYEDAWMLAGPERCRRTLAAEGKADAWAGDPWTGCSSIECHRIPLAAKLALDRPALKRTLCDAMCARRTGVFDTIEDFKWTCLFDRPRDRCKKACVGHLLVGRTGEVPDRNSVVLGMMVRRGHCAHPSRGHGHSNGVTAASMLLQDPGHRMLGRFLWRRDSAEVMTPETVFITTKSQQSWDHRSNAHQSAVAP